MDAKKPFVVILLAQMPEAYDQLVSEGLPVLMFPANSTSIHWDEWDHRAKYSSRFCIWSRSAPDPKIEERYCDGWKASSTVVWLEIP